MNKLKDKLSKLLNYIYVLLTSRGDFILLNAWVNIKFDRVKKRNFGDELNYYLLRELTGKHIAGYYNICHIRQRSDLMFIGSLVEEFTTSNSIIWGSGAISGDKVMRHKPAKVCAVRGKLTRQYLLSQGVDCPEIYGDPALLLPMVYQPNIEKKYKIGLIPHIHDLENPIVKKLLISNLVHLIRFNDYGDWHSVIDEINQCEMIASSSLHGLIISDAYNIPNVWIRISDKIEGGNFKFLDYFSAVNRLISEPFIIDNEATAEKLKNEAKSYTSIEFDVRPFILASPIKIKKI